MLETYKPEEHVQLFEILKKSSQESLDFYEKQLPSHLQKECDEICDKIKFFSCIDERAAYEIKENRSALESCVANYSHHPIIDAFKHYLGQSGGNIRDHLVFFDLNLSGEKVSFEPGSASSDQSVV